MFDVSETLGSLCDSIDAEIVKTFSSFLYLELTPHVMRHWFHVKYE
jgi:hypothetical protein